MNRTQAPDAVADLTRELGRLIRLRDQIEQPQSCDDVRIQERVRHITDRIAVLEDELSYHAASSLPGALGQALVAFADISYMLESEFSAPLGDLPYKERLRRMVYSIAKCLATETGIDPEALAGSYAPSCDPFADFVSAPANIAPAN